MIFVLRLLAALGLAGLMAFSSVRLERRLDGGMHVLSDHGAAQPEEPAIDDGAAGGGGPAGGRRSPAEAGPGSEPRPAAEEGPAAGLELRAFVPGGAEHRADLRFELFGPAGVRYAVAFAAPPYRVMGLQPGDWRVAVAGPVLAGRAGAVRLELDRVERLSLTHTAPTLDELTWPLPPAAAPQGFATELEHLQPSGNQTAAPVTSPQPAAAVPASR